MFKIFPFKFLFLSCLTPLCLLLVYGCNNKSFDENKNKNNSEYIEKIEAVAALGQLNPLELLLLVPRVELQDFLNY